MVSDILMIKMQVRKLRDLAIPGRHDFHTVLATTVAKSRQAIPLLDTVSRIWTIYGGRREWVGNSRVEFQRACVHNPQTTTW